MSKEQMSAAKHTAGPWFVAHIPTRKGVTFGLERDVAGSNVREPMRGPKGRELRFRSAQAAAQRGAA